MNLFSLLLLIKNSFKMTYKQKKDQNDQLTISRKMTKTKIEKNYDKRHTIIFI